MLLLAAALFAAQIAEAAAPQASKPAAPSPSCPRTTSHFANKGGLYRGKPLTPRKLTELPPAIGYMAVYRLIGGCEAPLTVVDYRNPRRR